MKIDRADLERHYASLSEEGLREIHLDDLTDQARNCFVAELRARNLPVSWSHAEPEADTKMADGDELDEQDLDHSDPPGLVTVHTFFDAGDAAEARNALENAGIECVLEGVASKPSRGPSQFQLRVDPQHRVRAENVLAECVFNPVREQTFQTHFESLNDEELFTLDLSSFVAESRRNRDLITRVRVTYRHELERRGLPIREFAAEAQTPGDADWTEVSSFLTPGQATLAQHLLAAAKIEYRLEKSIDELEGTTILVPAASYEEACQVLEAGMTDDALQAITDQEDAEEDERKRRQAREG